MEWSALLALTFYEFLTPLVWIHNVYQEGIRDLVPTYSCWNDKTKYRTQCVELFFKDEELL